MMFEPKDGKATEPRNEKGKGTKNTDREFSSVGWSISCLRNGGGLGRLKS